MKDMFKKFLKDVKDNALAVIVFMVLIVWLNHWLTKAFEIDRLNASPKTVYVIDKKTMEKIDNIHILAIQNMKENQRLRQYFDKESER